MKDIGKVVKLDFLSLIPYFTLKNIVIFIGLGIFYSYLLKTPTAVFATGLLFGVTFSAYPFVVGDVSGMESLYVLCGISKKSVVKGRYLTGFLLSVGSTLLCGILAVIVKFSFKFELDLLILVLTIIYSIIFMMFIISLQYPIFFKLGYMKGKMAATISVISVFIIIYVGISFSGSMIKGFTENPVFVVKIIIPATMLITVISFIASKRLSIHFYEKRDF